MSGKLAVWQRRMARAGAFAFLCFPFLGLADEVAEEEMEIVPLPVVESDRSAPVSFAEEIYPLLKQNCIPCHSASKAKAKLNLESPETIQKGSSDGPVVMSGKGAESLLFLTAAHRHESVMPPEDNKANARNLAPEELGLLKLWIDQGATGEAPGAMPTAIAWQPVSPEIAPIYACAVAPDKRFIAFARGNRLFVYDGAAGEIEAELVDPEVAGSPAAHLDLVQALDFNRAGLLASGGFRMVKFWKRGLNARAADLDPPAAAVSALAEAGDGNLVVAGGSDGEVIAWTASEWEKSARRWRDHGSAPVVSVGLRAGNGSIWSIGGDGSFRFRQPVNSEAAPGTGNFGTPVNRALGLGGDRFVLGLPDGTIRVVKLDGEMPVVEREWQGHPDAVTGLWLRGEDEVLSISAAENQAKLWRISDGGQVRNFDQGGAVTAAAVGGTLAATGGANHGVKLWNCADGKLVFALRVEGAEEGLHAAARLRLDIATARRDAESGSLSAAVKRTEELAKKARESAVAAAKAADTAMKAREVWATAERVRNEAEIERDRRTGSQHPRLAQAEEALKKATDAATKLKTEFEKLQKEMTGASRNEELARRESVDAARAQAEADAAAALAAEEFARATEGLAEVVKARDVAAARDVNRLAFNADASRLAGALLDGTLLVWSTKSGSLLEEIPAPEGATPVTALRFLGNGDLLAAREDRSVAIWKGRHAWNLTRRIGDPARPDILAARVNALAFDGEGGRLATGGGEASRGGELKIWDVGSGDLLRAYPDLHSDSVLSVTFSPDGGRVLTTGADRFARIVTLDDSQPLISLEGHAAHVLAGTWRADGRAVATGGADKVVKLWRPDGGGATQTIEGYGKEVTGLRYAGFREQLLSASGDGSVRVGNDRFPNVQGYQHVCVSSPDGTLAVAGGEDGVLRGWQVEGKKLLFELRP